MTTQPLLYKKPANDEIWTTLYGSSLPLALAEFCLQTPGIKLLIAKDNHSAAQLKAELEFFLGDPKAEMLFFPDWETLPYDMFSPHQDIISERLSTLSRIQQSQQAIVISSINTLMSRLCPVNFLNQYGLSLKLGQTLNIETFRQQLLEAGYYSSNKVLEHGEFAIRGSIVDVFPMGSRQPFRIELFDDEIESLRIFDTETQLSKEKISDIAVLPAREMPLNDNSIKTFREAFRASFSGNPRQCPVYEQISDGRFAAGIEYYLPLFFEETSSFFDYLPEGSHICRVEDLFLPAQAFQAEIHERYEQRRHDIQRPLLAPEQLFLKADELMAELKRFPNLQCFHRPESKKGRLHAFAVNKAPSLPIDRKAELPLKALKDYHEQHPARCLIVVESAGRREVLLDLLKQSQMKAKTVSGWQDFLTGSESCSITTGPLIYGAELLDWNIHIVVESQLFGEQAVPQSRTSKKTINPDLIIRDLAELNIGDPVVHIQFGVGRYQGLQCIESDHQANEFLILSYAGDDKIYVPVTSLHMISRYTGADSAHAPLHRLGTDQWQKEKKKAAEKIHDIAIELLDIYAKRAARPGFKHELPKDDYQRFVSAFPFTETEDQLKAIESIIEDMASPQPMDRLICGDVGFGKTEVAMRAAFIAAQNSKQVCILAPTTLLAGQHFATFSDRFADFPVNIELLSRFRSAKETEKALSAMEAGTADIIIGTHKLLQRDIKFKNLGLLIIDEEHRFGVKQKEHIKSLRNHVDILSMTATPIPRTLNMAMAGLRDISLIATPPAKRLAVKTFWQQQDNKVLREALLREILRGGQVYFLHNNVQTIARIVEDLEKLVPEAKIRFAHGQMRERELESIMSDFYHQRFNVLVCTTIIETGIDIPTANTIIIDQADKFGLAQLHQLRGRVGRSHHQAYAYLITAPKKSLTADAKKRLEAIVSLEDLGAGFTLATHDLEIRGAGELLGEEQSGNMQAIGFSLFMEMLDKAVEDLKAGKTPELSAPLQQGTEVELRFSALIPENYIADVHNRLIMYKRIANAKNSDVLQKLQVEMIDRFGLLPPQAKHLFKVTQLKLFATAMGVERISLQKTEARIEFKANASIDGAKLIPLIQQQSQKYRMDGPRKLRITLDSPEPEQQIEEVLDNLKQISAK